MEPMSSPRGRRPSHARASLAVVAMISLASVPARGIVTSNAGSNPFNGLYVNNYIGATTFYSNGYTGSRSIVANIEGGAIWNGHETLGQVTTYLKSPDPSLVGTQLGEFDRHATWVGQTIGGRGSTNYQKGIAYGTTLWSGSIATSWNPPPFSLSFNYANGNALLYPYITAMQTGVNGKTADVINSSWGNGNTTGSDPVARAIDGLIYSTGKTFVASAGNGGPGPNSVGSPASGYNGISVGALGTDTDPIPYNAPSNFSSRGPNDFQAPGGPVLPGVRPAVDIAAPGQNLTLALYGGTTGGNKGGTDGTNGASNFYSFYQAGTSFAAPIVAGGAALLADVGHDRFGGGDSIDGRVIKAVLLNSADKTLGWNNGQIMANGVVVTTQSLDYAVGAGRLDLTRAFSQYTSGTTGLVGGHGGFVQATGWDFGTVSEGSPDLYAIQPTLARGSMFTVTLDWFVHRSLDSVAPGGTFFTSDDSFDQLDLRVYEVLAGGSLKLVADAETAYYNVDHLYFALPDQAQYDIQVSWAGQLYNTNGDPHQDQFGLAWSSTAAAVPEPSSMALLAIGLPAAAWRFRRRSRRA